MQVKSIPLPADAKSRGIDWPCVMDPTAAELAAIEAELKPEADALDWQRWADGLAVEVGALSEAVAAAGGRVPPAAATVYRWQDLSTEALVALVQAGHMDALDPLYRRFADEVRAVAWHRASRNAAVADEVVAETWAGVVASVASWAPKVRTETDFRKLLFGLLKFKAMDVVYGQWRETTVEQSWLLDLRQPSTEPTADGGQAQQLADQLRDGMAGLSTNRREVIRLACQGLSVAEIATALGLTAMQVYSLRAQAIIQLRNRLCDPLAEATPQQVRQAADTLAEPHRLALLMQLDGATVAVIAERLGVTKVKTHNVLGAAREKVRRKLAEPKANGLDDLAAARQRRESRRAQLLDAIDQIPAGLREVARLRIQGTRNKDVALALGISESNANIKWSYARTAFERLGFGVIEGRVSAWATAPNRAIAPHQATAPQRATGPRSEPAADRYQPRLALAA